MSDLRIYGLAYRAPGTLIELDSTDKEGMRPSSMPFRKEIMRESAHYYSIFPQGTRQIADWMADEAVGRELLFASNSLIIRENTENFPQFQPPRRRIGTK